MLIRAQQLLAIGKKENKRNRIECQIQGTEILPAVNEIEKVSHKGFFP